MGLLGGIARTAIASGTWTAVSNRVSRRQANRWAGQDQQQQYYQQQQYQQPQYYQQPASAPAPPPAAPAARDPVAQLKDLADLKSQGILTEDEFAAQKSRILAAR
jgi:hypothetical protein